MQYATDYREHGILIRIDEPGVFRFLHIDGEGTEHYSPTYHTDHTAELYDVQASLHGEEYYYAEVENIRNQVINILNATA